MKIVISGASGLLGKALTQSLEKDGHEVFPLIRKRNKVKKGIYWDPEKGEIDQDDLEGMDAVVHLAGENIANGRWTEAQKKKIWDSRIEGTRLLVDAIAKLKNPPKVLVSASAMGYYGDKGDEWLSEEAPVDDSFLSRLCQAWEAEAQKAESIGIRVICVRIGLVVAADGGALASMLTPFKLGLGGVLGSGKQYISWILLEDLVRVFRFALEKEDVSGPLNAASPNPVTNREWTKTLGKVLGRPTLLPAPAFVLRAVLGEMAESLLLCSARMSTARLVELGFTINCTDLEAALKKSLL